MSFEAQAYDKLRRNFELLRVMLRHSKHPELGVDLRRIEEIIRHRIPESLKNNAPADFHAVYSEFLSEYERFKDFILYDKLIGKSVVALGGGFSSGKSSFLNALLANKVLPTDIGPSTSVPTYIVHGTENRAHGVYIFDTKFDMEPYAVRRIAHGFGKLGDDPEESEADAVTLGHVLEKIFLATPLQPYENIAFLDTPGYSKADNANHSARTDEQIARRQLNSSHSILWFVQADGTITGDDIDFLRSLRADIPKLIIVNKADKKDDGELAAIIAKNREVLQLRGIKCVDVLAFSSLEPNGYDIGAIREHLESWNKRIRESPFARNFKTLFIRCKRYAEEEIDREGRRLSRLNRIRMLLDREEDGIRENLEPLIAESKRRIGQFKRIGEELKRLQDEFFAEIKRIADLVGIAMPEPSEIDLIRETTADPLQLLRSYTSKNGLKTGQEHLELLKETFAELDPVLHKQPGGSGYRQQLVDVIRAYGSVDPKNVRYHEVYRTSRAYLDILRALGSQPTDSGEEQTK